MCGGQSCGGFRGARSSSIIAALIVAVGGGVSVVGDGDGKGGVVSGDGESWSVIADLEITAEIKGSCGVGCITVAIGESDGLLNAELVCVEGQIVIAVSLQR